MLQPIARARVRWRTPQEGGRASGPPSGSIYAPTAQFDSGPEYFSIILRYLGGTADNGRTSQDWELTLLAPENLPDVAARLVPGTRLHIMEGRRVVADCDLLAVRTEDRAPCPVF